MLQKIIKKAQELGFSDVEIVVNTSQELQISVFKGNVDKNFFGSDTSYVVKGIINNKMAIYSFQKDTMDLTDKQIEEIVLKLKDNVLAINALEENSIFAGSESYPEVKEIESGIDKTSIEDKIALVKSLEKKSFDTDPRIELISYCKYIEEKNKVKMINSKGLDLEKENNICGVILGVVAGESKDNPNKQNGFEVKVVNKYSDLNADEIVKTATTRAISMLGAAPIASKVYPVIINNDSMIDILNGFFSMFTGEAALKKLTSLTDKLDTKIMSEKITIVDDPMNEKAVSQNPFDAEGVATYRKEVVSKGIFKLFLQNLKTAKALNKASTGNASTSSIKAMNFHITNGTTSEEDMIASIKEGLFITELNGLHAGLNAISGDFNAQASGFYIENGKIVKPVTLVVLSGNFLQMMSDVETVGNNLKIEYTGFGAPSILFKGLAISGK